MSPPAHPPDVSVVMGTFNGARFLREQLASILAQDELPLEIVVSDDGSTDDTLAVVAEVAAVSPVPVRVLRNPVRLGFADNFLHAAGHATGRFVAFSDQDDRWYPSKLRLTREALLAHDAVLCVHTVDDVDMSGRHLRLNRQHISGLGVLEPLEGNPWGVYYGFTMLFERSLLDRVDHRLRGLDVFSPGQPLAHDRWVYFLALTYGRIVTLPNTLAGYRQHESQLYGGARRRSAWRRVLDKLAHGRDQLTYRLQVADQRVAMLAGLAGPADPAAGRALAHWRRLRAEMAASAAIRGAGPRGGRLALWWREVRSGGYGSAREGGLGHRHLLEDLAFVVLPVPPTPADPVGSAAVVPEPATQPVVASNQESRS